jgi:hypothetical protein
VHRIHQPWPELIKVVLIDWKNKGRKVVRKRSQITVISALHSSQRKRKGKSQRKS